jgi:hypothetical protein
MLHDSTQRDSDFERRAMGIIHRMVTWCRNKPHAAALLASTVCYTVLSLLLIHAYQSERMQCQQEIHQLREQIRKLEGDLTKAKKKIEKL